MRQNAIVAYIPQVCDGTALPALGKCATVIDLTYSHIVGKKGHPFNVRLILTQLRPRLALNRRRQSSSVENAT